MISYRKKAGRQKLILLWVLFQGASAFAATLATPQTLEAVNKQVSPGSIVLLESGTYTTPIAPATSGTQENPIVYKPAEGARPVFKQLSPAIMLEEKSFIKIEGLQFLDCPRFMLIQSSSHITIENCEFENGKAWESCRLKTMGDFFHFKNNRLKNGTDLLSIQGGNFHLIEGNTFNRASHTCLVLMGVHDSVIRRNRFVNPDQKLLEIFATRQREWTGTHRKSERILIEHNLFGPNGHKEIYKGKQPSASWGTQFAGVQCILRNNIFAGCGGGMDFTGYGKVDGDGDSPEAAFNHTNRVYNNTLYANGQQGRYGSGPGLLLSHNEHTAFYDNIFINNIFYANRIFKDAHTRENVPSVQIAFSTPADPSDTRISYNNIIDRESQDQTVVWFKRKNLGYTLEAYESAFPDFSGNNIQGNPRFVNAEPNLQHLNHKEFELEPNSPCVDAGGCLTYTVGKGSGKALPVEDPYFFSDGFGIVEGDLIRVGSREVRVMKVDYEEKRLHLSAPLQWEDHSAISPPYKGKAPDIGAIESF